MRALLIADPEPHDRRTLTTFLSQEGYHCVCTADPKTTVATLRSAFYDFFITDLTTAKGFSGELVAEIQRSGRLPPTILILPPSLSKVASHTLHLPVAASLMKPVEFRDLLGALPLRRLTPTTAPWI